MRGAPPLHLVILAVAFVLFAIPLAQLTFARNKTVMIEREAPMSVSTGTKTLLRIRFAHVPKSLSLKMGDRELIPSASLISPLDVRVEMVIPSEGMDLMLDVTWPEGTPETAVTIDLEPDGLDTKSQTRWSTGGQLREILSYIW